MINLIYLSQKRTDTLKHQTVPLSMWLHSTMVNLEVGMWLSVGFRGKPHGKPCGSQHDQCKPIDTIHYLFRLNRPSAEQSQIAKARLRLK